MKKKKSTIYGWFFKALSSVWLSLLLPRTNGVHPDWTTDSWAGHRLSAAPLSTFLSRSCNTLGAEEKARKRLPPVRYAQVTTCYRARKNERKSCAPDESRVNCSLKPGPPMTSPGFFSARRWDLIISWTSFSLQNTFWVAVLFLFCTSFTSS